MREFVHAPPGYFFRVSAGGQLVILFQKIKKERWLRKPLYTEKEAQRIWISREAVKVQEAGGEVAIASAMQILLDRHNAEMEQQRFAGDYPPNAALPKPAVPLNPAELCPDYNDWDD